MEEFNDGLKIYSEEVRDVLSDPPKAIQKWGNTILLLFITILFLISWFVKYPDIITSQILITTTIPPQKVVSRTTGKVEVVLVKNKELVNENTVLAVLENTANYKDVFELKKIIKTINISKNKFPFELFNSAQLGEIENSFAAFRKEYIAEQLNNSFQPYRLEEIAQTYEANQLHERLSLLESQKEINQNELLLQKNDLKRYETLYHKGIYSTQEFEKQQLLYLQSQKSYKTLLGNISQLKSSLNELKRNSKTTLINESKEYTNLENNKIQAFHLLKEAIDDWELNYVLKSSIHGKVNFLDIWFKNQTVNIGDNVFSIIPTSNNIYIGKLKAKALNSGKIKIGQLVNIKLNDFPHREFGMLKGQIKNISLIPDKEGNQLIDISLSNGLKTTSNKKILFKQEMQGNADIITEDLRLIERLLYQFKDLFKRS